MVFINNTKGRIIAHESSYYPDVLLTFNQNDNAPIFKQSPGLIAEVLSQFSETIDRREKLVAYRCLASLRYYLLVSQECRRIELHYL